MKLFTQVVRLEGYPEIRGKIDFDNVDSIIIEKYDSSSFVKISFKNSVIEPRQYNIYKHIPATALYRSKRVFN